MTRTTVCERVPAQISLRLDGELSELESRMLDAHIARCAACRSYDADVESFTQMIRAAPLETLERRPVLATHPRRVSLPRSQVGVAAATLVVAITLANSLLTGSSGVDQQAFRSPDVFATSAELEREIDRIVADGLAFKRVSGQGRVPI